jgi:hypothetical protein
LPTSKVESTSTPLRRVLSLRTCPRRACAVSSAGRQDGSPSSPRMKQLWLRATAPVMTSARASASLARSQGPVRMCSPNRNTPSRPADRGSRTVKPGCEAASGPAASACEASSIVAAPATRSTYSDQVEKIAPGPSPRWELSSLMTAATKPHAIPVAAPSNAARRDGGAPGRLPGPKATARAASTTPNVSRPASSHEEPGACSRPPDGDARPRNRPIPADIAAAASKSRFLTRTCRRPAIAM